MTLTAFRLKKISDLTLLQQDGVALMGPKAPVLTKQASIGSLPKFHMSMNILLSFSGPSLKRKRALCLQLEIFLRSMGLSHFSI